MRQITGAAIATAAACVLAAIALANIPAAGHSAPPVTKKNKHTQRVVGRSPVLDAPFYVALDNKSGNAIVRHTATGAKIATVRHPAGATFSGVGGSEGDQTFVLAAGTSAGPTRIYRLVLNGKGKPGQLTRTAIPPLPKHFGNCPAEAAGLAVSPDASMVAVSVLSNCPTGNAGPSEILTARLGTGKVLATFHPGNSYPMWLSWSQAGSLAYSFAGSGIFVIAHATKPGAKTRLVIGNSFSVGGFSGADSPLFTADGLAVLATVARDSDTFAIGEFSIRGTVRRLLISPVRNPNQFCGALWSDLPGTRLLLGCGDGSEFEYQNGKLTKLHSPWQLPTYNVPGPPFIAW